MTFNGYYYKKPSEIQNLKEFHQLVTDMDLQLRWPKREEAPWHVHILVGQNGPNPQKINAWPHLLKVYWSGHRGPRLGAAAIFDTIVEATDAAYDYVDLFEDEPNAPSVS